MTRRTLPEHLTSGLRFRAGLLRVTSCGCCFMSPHFMSPPLPLSVRVGGELACGGLGRAQLEWWLETANQKAEMLESAGKSKKE